MVRRGKIARFLLCGSVFALLPATAWAQSSTDGIEEVVVTASKTGQDVHQIAGSVTAITGAQLQEQGAQSAKDYLSTTPGVVFNEQNPGFSTITIRGVNTSTSFSNISQGTTGSYIDDVPLTDPFFSAGTPDIDTFDVRDIEIYRGPQGTLFGSSSLGGAVNYIANTPDLSQFGAALETTQSWTDGAGGLNSAYKAMINAPIVDDVFGIRAVGIFRHDAGYIDNLGTGHNNSNRSDIGGGRILAAWQPSDKTRISFISLYQKSAEDDAPYQDPAFGDLKKFTNVPEKFGNTVEIDSLKLDQDLGFATLTALASYHRKTANTVDDVKQFGAFGFDSPSVHDGSHSRGWTYEARLRSPTGQPFTWLIGAMYDRTREEVLEHDEALNAGAVADALLGPGGAAAATIGDIWGVTDSHFVGKEMAIFGEAAYKFDNFTLTAGGRAYKTETDSQTDGFGLLYAAFVNGQLTSTPPAVKQKDTGFNPKFSVSYDFNPKVRVYALASKGFRFGGANVNPDPSLPRTYGSDSLWNYEAGIKSTWMNDTLLIDADVFDIDWNQIQLNVVTVNGTQGIVNAGTARVQGAEIATVWQATDHFSLNANVTYTDAVLRSVNPGPGQTFDVTAGSTLPGASKWMLSGGARYQWDGPLAPYLAATYRYVSHAPALLQQFPLQNPTVGGYNLFGLRAGVTLGDVQLSAFASNLTNERGVVTATYTGALGNTVNQYIVQPRTIGLTVDWKY